MKTILVVDDEQDIILALEILLSDEGFEVITAQNGREALERLAERLPDVVIMDVMMPILSGPQTLEKMRSDAEYTQIPVIMMSAVKPSIDFTRLKVSSFIRKPFEISAMLDAIDQVLQGKNN